MDGRRVRKTKDCMEGSLVVGKKTHVVADSEVVQNMEVAVW